MSNAVLGLSSVHRCAGAFAGWPLGPTEAIELRLPINCEIGVTCEVQNYVDLDPSSQARDYQCGSRTYDGHKGMDFRLPSLRAQRAGVNVLAAAPGRVLRVRDGVPDMSVRERGIGAVNGRECGNGVVVDHGEGWSTQYCHMAQGSLLVKPGDKVEASQPLGRVGLSGMTEYPHLHFAVTFQGKTGGAVRLRSTPRKLRWRTVAVGTILAISARLQAARGA